MDVCVSVIMPVYNVEKYIKRAVDSILGGSFADFEIILCDDGSTDSSGRICDELSSSDERIITIHKKNGGVSSARNAALEIARGRYVYFMDPDDYVLGDVLAENIEIAEKYGCDQVIFSFESEICDSLDKPINHVKYCHGLDGVLTYGEFKDAFLTHLQKVHQVVWNRIYRKSTIEGVRFSERIVTAEDAVFNLELVKKGFDKVFYNDKIYYSYMCRVNSLMNKFNPHRFENEMIILDTISEIVTGWGVEEGFRKYLASRYVESMLTEYSNLVMKDCPFKGDAAVDRIKACYNDKRVLEAIKIIRTKDMDHITIKITYLLSNAGMFGLAVRFRKMYTVLSQTAHKILYALKR